MAMNKLLCSAILQLLMAAIVYGDILRYTENELTASSAWRKGDAAFVLLQADEHSPPRADALQTVLGGSGAVHIVMVECAGSEQSGEVCSLLSSNGAAVRGVGEGVMGVRVVEGVQTTFVSRVLEALLGPRLVRADSAHFLKHFAEESEEFLLALVLQTTSNEYHSLLASTLAVGTHPLVVALATELLPLQYRPRHTPKPAPITLWFVSGSLWLPPAPPHYRDDGTEWITKFVQRTQYPALASYKGPDSVAVFADSSLDLVYLFTGLSGHTLDLPSLAEAVIKECFTHYAILTVERSEHPQLGQELYLDQTNAFPRAIVVPFDKETGTLVNIELPTTDLATEAEGLVYMLHSLAYDQTGAGGGDDPLLSITDLDTLGRIATEDKFDILAVFCNLGHSSCPGDHYYQLDRAIMLLADAGLSDLRAYLVECSSVEGVVAFQLNSLPSFAFYNRSVGVWRGEGGEGGASDLIALVAASKGLQTATELVGDFTVSSFQTPPSSSSVSKGVRHEAQEEDDHFGLLSHSLPPAVPLPELALTTESFDGHIAGHDCTVVVFHLKWCVKSKVFLHHVLAAMERLDQSVNGSVATVDCAGYTDLCQRFSITTLPSALVFTPSHPHTPTPLPTGTLDAQSLLSAFREQPAPAKLVEATPTTLPILLRGSLATPLILWCGSHVTSEVADKFAEVSPSFPTLSFAWLRSSEHSDWLRVKCPAVIAVNFAEHGVYEVPSLAGLEAFLWQLTSGQVEPTGSLGHREWSPRQPPIPFPSFLKATKDSDQYMPPPPSQDHTPPPSPPSHHHSEL